MVVRCLSASSRNAPRRVVIALKNDANWSKELFYAARFIVRGSRDHVTLLVCFKEGSGGAPAGAASLAAHVTHVSTHAPRSGGGLASPREASPAAQREASSASLGGGGSSRGEASAVELLRRAKARIDRFDAMPNATIELKTLHIARGASAGPVLADFCRQDKAQVLVLGTAVHPKSGGLFGFGAKAGHTSEYLAENLSSTKLVTVAGAN